MNYIIILICIFLTFVKAQEFDDLKDFDQEKATLTGVLELEEKLTIFHKLENKWLAAYQDDNQLKFFYVDKNLSKTDLKPLTNLAYESILDYHITDTKITLNYFTYERGYYGKSIVFDFESGAVESANLIYAMVSPDDFGDKDWYEDLNYKFTENKDKILIMNYEDYENDDLKIPKAIFNQNSKSTLFYNFIKTENDDLDVYYSIVSTKGELISSNRFKIIPGFYDKNEITNGFYGGLSDKGNPFFIVDNWNNNKRQLSLFSIIDGSVKSSSVDYPIEINGDDEHWIKHAKNVTGESLLIYAISSEEDDDFPDTYGLLKLEISSDLTSINKTLKVLNEDEVETLTGGEDLGLTKVSDIVTRTDGTYILLEASDVFMFYINGMSNPKHLAKEILTLKFDENFNMMWSDYVEYRDFERFLGCDNDSRLFMEPELRYKLAFNNITNEQISFYYHDLDKDEHFGERVLNSNTGNLISNTKLFEAEKLVYIYPFAINNLESETLMYVSNFCKSNIIKFSE